MINCRLRVLVGSLILLALLASSAPGILGFPDGVGDGGKDPSTCTSCHGTAGTGTVTVTAPVGEIHPGDAVDLTVTVTEETLAGEGMVGVFLLKGSAGTHESVTVDGWTILKDPNGNVNNYVERPGLSTGVAARFVWSLKAPPAAGDYVVHADVKHGGNGPVTETSAPLAVAVTPAGTGGSAPPAIEPPSLPPTVVTGNTLNVSARMTDSDNGIALAVLRYRLPGASDFAASAMILSEGTANDGVWAASIGVGGAAGALELWLEATDGTNDARSPASGTFTVLVASPPGPAIEALPPGDAAFGSAPEVWARILDGTGASNVQVRYRHESETAYRVAGMALRTGNDRDGQWSASLPAANATGTWSFFVSARNARSEGRSAEMAFKVLPDLFVSSMVLSTNHLLVKQKAVIKAVIGNRGDRPVTGLSVHFLDQSYNVGDVRCIRVFTNLTVPANGQVELRASWTPMVDGKRDLAVVLNPDGRVEEGNLTNDRLTATVPVVLASGIGIRFPVPKPADLQLQIAVIVIGAAVLGGRIFLWQYNAEKKAEAAREERRKKRAAEMGGRED